MTEKKSWKLRPDQRQAILERFAAGEKLKAIAADYGVHWTYPSKLAKKEGLKMRVVVAPKGIGKVSQIGVPDGYRRLASGKIIKFYPAPR